VKIELLPSSVSDSADGPSQYLTSYIVNDVIAIDAGSLGIFKSPKDQSRIKHVFLSHSHIDHVATLPLFVDNVYTGTSDCVTVHAGREVTECLKRDVFNDRVWPDFIGMSEGAAPFFKLASLESSIPVFVDGLKITPIHVDHIVETFGFVIEDPVATVIVVSDTGPTDEIWNCANTAPNLKAVFLEAAFPNSLADVAFAAKHLTPALFAREAMKLKRAASLIAVHIKPRFRDQILRELRELSLEHLEIGEAGKVYQF
jgi:ribonuclease BN (tRNA processing enzyme)